MTDTFNVRQRALSQPLTVEVVGGKRPRTATRATASQPETRRPGTQSRTFVSTHTRLESLDFYNKFFEFFSKNGDLLKFFEKMDKFFEKMIKFFEKPV